VTIGSGQRRRTIYGPRDGSYLSSSDYRILLALPAGPTGHLTADVSCPGGRSAAAIDLEADTYQRVTVREAAREDP
jgi:hypothetical protein